MKGLIVKDICLLSKRGTFFLLLIGITIFMGFSSSIEFLSSYIPLIGALFTLTTISYDEYNNGMPFLMTLPVKPTMYAIEKYLFAAIVGACIMAFGIAEIAIIGTINHNANLTEDLLMSMITMVIAFSFIVSLFIPIELQFGPEKGRIVLAVVSGVVALLVIVGMKTSNTIGFDASVIITMIKGVPEAVITAAVVAIAVIIIAISMLISVLIMKKKEF